MTDKQLKKLRRVELLEMLVEQAAEMERLQALLDKAEKALEDRRVLVNEAGTMADAVLQINQLLQTAEQTAKDYIESAKAQADAILAEAKKMVEEQAEEGN